MPNAKIDGTQIPTNIAESFSPLNQEASENKSESRAAIMSSLSDEVNFLNIKFNILDSNKSLLQ
jgi:hypothetical protein